jgi:membrane protein DedA with SNARE-associated domain
VGLPGPGEAALIAAGVLAAHDRLDIGAVVVVSWLGASVGGMTGWAFGLAAGRPVFESRGPLRNARLRLLALGDRLFARFGMIAVFLTPSWIAGIHRMPWTRYLPANAMSALVWALLVGLGAFFAGPAIAHLFSDHGWWASALIGAVVLAALALERRRRAARPQASRRRSWSPRRRGAARPESRTRRGS